MTHKFSFRVQQIIRYSREEALRLGHDAIGTEHLLLGLLRLSEGTAIRIITNLGTDIKDMREVINETIGAGSPTITIGEIPFTRRVERILRSSYFESRQYKSEVIGTEHLLLALAKDDDGLASQVLTGFNIHYESIKLELETMIRDGTGVGEKGGATSKKKSKTPALDHFSRDLTALAKKDELDPIIGREKEIERVAQILSRRKKNNPVLIGDPGVGKTAIVEGLALRIIQKRVSPILFNKRVVVLDIGSLVAGTKYRGQFEERMKSIINELNKNRETIIFLDELHTIVGAGSASGSLDASNMFKPALARGELQCIGATTLDEYRQHIEKDGALERRFQKIMVDPPSVEESIDILNGLKERYEKHHSVVYTPEAIVSAVHLSDRYISDRFLPDKALDVMDETGSRARLKHVKIPEQIVKFEKRAGQLNEVKEELVKQQEYEKAALVRDEIKRLDALLEVERKDWEASTREKPIMLDSDHVSEVVAMMTGIPVTRVLVSESERLLNIEKELSKKIIGQDAAITAIAKSIRRNRSGLYKRNRPIGSFIFLGPSGIGKTETAKVLSEFLFEDPKALIRVDMSEYMEKFNVSRLIGAPPGYVGYDDGGQLSERVRRKPYSIVLLDEIEKAHPDIFNVLLQVLDAGTLTDGTGRMVDFRNTILIMTSNLGTREVGEKHDFGFGDIDVKDDVDYKQMSKKIKGIMKDNFPPEFVNRTDDIIVFNRLTRENAYEILELYLKDVQQRLSEQDVKISISEAVKDEIIDQGFSRETGARSLRRNVEKMIEDKLAEEMLKGEYGAGAEINAELNEGKIVFEDVKAIVVEENV
ncbi:MAG: ATP-dependent Clp protease ATP-binding subunit [Candidatus Hatepunaea meridiana]|nr:ATP-dependent Clp protease ATP-binding subunit [Candidatus Hatepunaea meridiana]